MNFWWRTTSFHLRQLQPIIKLAKIATNRNEIFTWHAHSVYVLWCANKNTWTKQQVWWDFHTFFVWSCEFSRFCVLSQRPKQREIANSSIYWQTKRETERTEKKTERSFPKQNICIAIYGDAQSVLSTQKHVTGGRTVSTKTKKKTAISSNAENFPVRQSAVFICCSSHVDPVEALCVFRFFQISLRWSVVR